MAMSQDEQDMIDRIKAGNFELSQIEPGRGVESNAGVTISDWQICYSEHIGQLTAYCTAIANDGDVITGIGMAIYSASGQQIFGNQYTNGFSGTQVSPSVGTQLYNTGMDRNVLCVVYGWTGRESFYFHESKSVGAC